MDRLETLDAGQLTALAKNVIATFAQRDADIADSRKSMDQTGIVEVPEAFKQTVTQVHNAMAREIPVRTAGFLKMRRPVYSRISPNDDIADNDRVATVKRYCQAADNYYFANAVPRKDAYGFACSQLVETGAICVGSIFAPHYWASVPPLTDLKGDFLKEMWVDSAGKATEDAKSMDPDAVSRHYKKMVDAYKRQAKPPIIRRYMETSISYPLHIADQMAAMFIKRKATAMELDAIGLETEGVVTDPTDISAAYDLLEVWLPNRIRYFNGTEEMRHRGFPGEKGIPTNYGFVPYSYRDGIQAGTATGRTNGAEAGSVAGGDYGKPVLWLVSSQLTLLDTLDTFALNAVYLASFPTYKFRYNDNSKSVEVYSERGGKEVLHYEIHSGEINDYGTDRELVPLENPGMNSDFYHLRDKVEEQIDKIIPRALRGEAESSGYNTLQASAQAKAIFEDLFTAIESSASDCSKMELRLIDRFVKDQPIYLEYAEQPDKSTPRVNLSRVKISAADIQGYYNITATVDKELDHITEGSFRAKMRTMGFGYNKWAEDGMGIPDSNEAERERAKDRLLANPEIQKQLDLDAIDQFNLIKIKKRMAAAGRIQIQPDGTMLVKMEDGTWFGPGMSQPGQLPQVQGPQGEIGGILGGDNPSVVPGGPNLNAGAPNPEALLPKNGQPAAMRMGGGAIPGAMQLQNLTNPLPQPVGPGNQ